MPERINASCAGLSSMPSRRPASGTWKEPASSRLILASQYPRSWCVTRSSLGQAAVALSRRPLRLSAGTALGNDQLGVPSGDPGVLPPRQLSQPMDLVLVGPDDQVLPRRRAARVDP